MVATTGGIRAWVEALAREKRTHPLYKPALLLVAIDLIEEGLASPDRVEPSEALARRFGTLLEEAGQPGKERLAWQPFYHLSTSVRGREPIWSLMWGRLVVDSGEPASLKGLRERVEYAAFREDLAAPLYQPEGRQRVREQIYRMLETEPASMALVKAHDPSWKDVDRARGMLRDSVAQQFQCFREHSRVVMGEHVRKARDRALRMEVLPLYEHRCALCGLRLRWRELVEAEAAHVVPVEKDGVDDVRNTLSLCRTHHWAFDSGLWTVDEGKRVEVVSPEADPEIDVEALIVFRGEGIRTPRQEEWGPHEEALAWHREYVFGREVA